MTDTLTVTRTFAAPRQLVWDAVVLPEHFSVWFGTAAVAVPLDELEWNPRAGTPWKAVMHLPDGNAIHWEGEFLEIEAPQRLVFTMTDAPGEYGGLPVTITLRDVDEGTELTYVQGTPGFGEEQVEATREGINAFFDTMAQDVLGL
jgi:uncharacterized protein YndB with AHSA1/START domain